jgi:heme-degrading monooxygenase HmoA
MICRVALHENPPGSITSDEARSLRAWLKEQPGFVGGYHAQDSQMGRMVSITVWDSQDSMEALKNSTPPGGPLGIVTEREELFDVVEEY